MSTKKSGLMKLFVWQCALALTVGAAAPSFAGTFIEFNVPLMPKDIALKEPEIQKLGTYDLALVIDKSASMTYRLNQRSAPTKLPEVVGLDRPVAPPADPGDSISRWDWCKNQAANLADQIKKVLPRGLKISMFSNDFDSYSNVDAAKVATLFDEVEPSGGTHVSKVLSYHFDEYFAQRQTNGQRTRPLLVAIITDGAPEDGFRTKEAIIRATKHMTRSDEILVAILQVGNDRRAPKILNDLDQELIHQNAKYDIVEVKTFAEIKKQGLAKTLANLVTREHVATLSHNRM